MAINHPILGVSGLIRNGDRLLLVKRGRPPLSGLWSLPGGKVETGEALDTAVAREIAEETGVAARDLRRIDVAEIIGRDAGGGVEYHYVLVVFAGNGSGQPVAADDAMEARWFTHAELAGLHLTEDTARVIARHAKADQNA